MRSIKRILSFILCIALALSFLPAGAVHVHAATLDSYLSSCTKYPSYVTLRTTAPTSMMSYPCSTATESGSANKGSLPAGTLVNATALYCNTAGEYWYQISRYGTTCYIKGADTTMVNHLAADLSLADMNCPGSLAKGQSFPISGVISTSLNKLGNVTAAMYWGNDITVAPSISATDAATGNSYSLQGSAIDYGLVFGNLATGVYTYVIHADLHSYYIDDNDALAESVKTVVADRQRCIITDYTNPNPINGWGADVSVWNGYIDWSKVSQNVDFMILRSGFEETTDNRFLEYAAGCEEYGIPFGVYVYSYAESVAEAEAEARYAVNLVKNYEMMQLPIYFDAEDEVLAALGVNGLRAVTQAFIDVVREEGFEAGIYTNKSWFDYYYDTPQFYSVAKWLAQIDGFYGGYTNSYYGGVHLWQYSWEGSCPGISGNLDVNYCYDLLPGQTNDTTYRSKCTAYDSHLLVTANASTTMMKYPCASSVDSSSTSLKSIASGTQLCVTALYKNTAGEYWYQVENGTGVGYIPANKASVDQFLYDDLGMIDPDMTDHLDVGAAYYLGGLVSAQYFDLATVHAKVYPGENTEANPTISSSYSPKNQKPEYFLDNSRVDRNLNFGALTDGYYTYEVSVDVNNHYVTASGSLATQKDNVAVWQKTFTVGTGSTVHTCTPVTIPAVDPTCTETGLTAGSACSICGATITAQQVIPAKGHKFANGVCATCGKACPHANTTSKKVDATCQEQAYTIKTCADCGLVYNEYASYGEWSATKPVNVPEDQIQTKLQYRYADQETITTANATEAGYTMISKGWNQGTQGTHDYVKTWGGFSTSHSLYTKYCTPVTGYEVEDEKVVVNSAEKTGYLYYHWCYTDSYYCVESKSGSYTTFHAYYDTTDPSNYTCDTSDMSYKTSHATCSNSSWWFVTDVYTQTYTLYKPAYTHAKWGSWSAWSDTEVAETDTRKVETQTLYRTANSGLADHTYVNGKCSVCGAEDPNQPTAVDYYLIGYINGKDYGCEGDYENMGQYKFTDGKLTAKFNSNSYVFLKTTDNADWYMTYEYETGTSATFYNTTEGTTEKMLVPGGVDVTFTLTENADGSLTLSYAIACAHASHDQTGKCTACSAIVSHSWSNGKCTVCGLVCTHTWKNSTCTICGAVCGHTWKNGVCSACGKICTSHNYVGGSCSICGKADPNYVAPTGTVTPKSLTLSLEDEVLYNLYFIVEGMDVSPENVGMLIYNSQPTTVSIQTADNVVEGGLYDAARGRFMASTPGIPGQYLADTLYLIAYAKDANGNYVYGRTVEYSGKKYCTSQMTKGTDALKATCVALMNYGAAAQEYFAATTDYIYTTPMNADFAQYQGLVNAYSSDMLAPRSSVDAAKAGSLGTAVNGFTKRSVSMSADGDFSLNYYFTTSKAVEKVTFYYWTAEQYNSVNTLTLANASGSKEMVLTDGTNRYWANLAGIAAKEIDQTIFACGVYTVNGTTYSTGVFSYSIGHYCTTKAASGDATIQPFAKAIAVYSYYAKILLATN